MLARNTYLEIKLKSLKNNVSTIKERLYMYKYYIGVVKADCYGHSCSLKVLKAIIDGGCNYLAVASLDEALDIRKKIPEIPILCLGPIDSQYIETCIQNNITVTVYSLDYLYEMLEEDCESLKVHLKINSGMNRIGLVENDEVWEAIRIIRRRHMNLEGIYTHIYNAEDEEDYSKQIESFEKSLKNVDLESIPIVHIAASESMVRYERPSYVNGCRLGIIMYGFTDARALRLKSTMSLVSEVVQINTLKKGETLGYGGAYKASEDEEKIAVVSIGYADGVIRKNSGRYVYIKDREYKIVGNICMDMLFVKVDDNVEVHDEVYILKDIDHIYEVSDYLDTIPYEVICSVGKRVPRVYKNK